MVPVGGGDLPHGNREAHMADAGNTSGNSHLFLTLSCCCHHLVARVALAPLIQCTLGVIWVLSRCYLGVSLHACIGRPHSAAAWAAPTRVHP